MDAYLVLFTAILLLLASLYWLLRKTERHNKVFKETTVLLVSLFRLKNCLLDRFQSKSIMPLRLGQER